VQPAHCAKLYTVKFVEVCKKNYTPHAMLFCKQQGNRYCSVQALIMLAGRSLRIVWGSVRIQGQLLSTYGLKIWKQSPNRRFVNKKLTDNHQNTTL